jgi:hypothetical protein
MKSIKKNIVLMVCAACIAASALPASAASLDQQPVSKEQNVQTVQKLPEVYEHLFTMYGKADEQTLITLRERIAKLLAEGKDSAAAAAAGAESAAESNSLDPYVYIGMVCSKFINGMDTVEQQAKFLSGFISGFRKGGVAVVPYEGIAKFSVYGNDGKTRWTAADSTGPAGDRQRIFRGKHAYFVPFNIGETFKINIYGKDGTTAKLWKVMPDGAKFKSWQGGKWEREITVNGK